MAKSGDPISAYAIDIQASADPDFTHQDTMKFIIHRERGIVVSATWNPIVPRTRVGDRMLGCRQFDDPNQRATGVGKGDFHGTSCDGLGRDIQSAAGENS